jgi:hypothetical protein
MQGDQGVEEEEPSEVGQPRVHGPAEARWQRRLDGASETGALQRRSEELIEIAGRVGGGVSVAQPEGSGAGHSGGDGSRHREA